MHTIYICEVIATDQEIVQLPISKQFQFKVVKNISYEPRVFKCQVRQVRSSGKCSSKTRKQNIIGM